LSGSDEATIEALAAKLREVFPELGGRCTPVSEMEVTRTNTPTFPVAMVALQDVVFNHSERSNKPPTSTETIIVEFWFGSRKKVKEGNKETPFWQFYNYEPLMQKMADLCMNWKTPRNYRLRMVRMDLESDELAVMVSFTLNHIYDICLTPEEALGPTRLVSNVCIPTGCEQ
jgi:hypothetical protein